MTQQKPVPKVGTRIQCCQKDVQFLGSNVPGIRIVLNTAGEWIASPDQKRGLLVYITRPMHFATTNLSSILITEVNSTVAFGSADV